MTREARKESPSPKYSRLSSQEASKGVNNNHLAKNRYYTL
jgi:hypothetical protein